MRRLLCLVAVVAAALAPVVPALGQCVNGRCAAPAYRPAPVYRPVVYRPVAPVRRPVAKPAPRVAYRPAPVPYYLAPSPCAGGRCGR